MTKLINPGKCVKGSVWGSVWVNVWGSVRDILNKKVGKSK